MSESNSTKACTFEGCDRTAGFTGLCYSHARYKREGKPLVKLKPAPRKRGTPPVITTREEPCKIPGLVGPCHVFTNCIRPDGYGSSHLSGGRTVLVHRYVWEQTHGPIPPGLEIDHQCRNRACCNVLHLRVVTHKVNSTENSFSVGAKNKVKTHCPAGHEYTPDNTRLSRKGARVCRACHTIRNRESARRKRARKCA